MLPALCAARSCAAGAFLALGFAARAATVDVPEAVTAGLIQTDRAGRLEVAWPRDEAFLGASSVTNAIAEDDDIAVWRRMGSPAFQGRAHGASSSSQLFGPDRPIAVSVLDVSPRGTPVTDRERKPDGGKRGTPRDAEDGRAGGGRPNGQGDRPHGRDRDDERRGRDRHDDDADHHHGAGHGEGHGYGWNGHPYPGGGGQPPAVPLPAALPLFGTGVLLLAGALLRRRRS